MPDLEKLAAQWADNLVGTKVAGTVTDPESGDTRDYHLLCSAVRVQGGKRVVAIWDDKLNTGWVAYNITTEKTAEEIAAALNHRQEHDAQADLEASRYDTLEGEEL